MKITHIRLENVLSFGKGEEALDLDVGNADFIVGPNNAGKTNLVRALRYFIYALNTYSPDLDKDIIRFKNDQNPFKMELTFEQDEDQIKCVKDYFRIFGIVAAKALKANPEVLEKYKVGGTDPKITFEKLIELFRNMWNDQSKKIVEHLLKDDRIKIVMEYGGNPELRPDIYIQCSDENDKDKIRLSKDDMIERPSPEGSNSHIDFLQMFFNSSIFKEQWSKVMEGKEIDNYSHIDSIFGDKVKTLKRGEKFSLRIQNISYSHPEIQNDINTTFPFLKSKENSGRIESVSLLEIITRTINKKITLSENKRNIVDKNSYDDYAKYKETYGKKQQEYKDYKEKETSDNPRYLPSMLYHLKNGGICERKRYKEIQKRFKTFTQMELEVAGEIHKPGDYIQIVVCYETPLMEHSIDFAGSGLSELLYILTLIVGKRDNVILLDEPAINLHPPWQNKIRDLIINGLDGKVQNQFIVITHSPYLLPDLKIEEEITSTVHYFSYDQKNRLTKKTTIYLKELEKQQDGETPEEKEKIRKQRLNNIKTINRKKRVFFASLNIVVEGQADEKILNRVVEEGIKIDETRSVMAQNIEIIDGEGGDRALSLTDILAKFNLPVVCIVDHDHKDKIKTTLGLAPNKVIILPSDLEGTMLLGEILWPLFSTLGKKYSPKGEIEKFDVTYENEKDIRSIVQRIDNLKSGKISLREFISTFINVEDSDLKKIESDIKEKIIPKIETVLRRLNVYIDKKIYKETKVNWAIAISIDENKDIFLSNFIEQMSDRISRYAKGN